MWVLAQNYIFESDHQSDFIEKPTKSTFFQGQTNNFTIFYLEKELIFVQREKKILEIMELFCEENNFDDPVHLCNFAAKFSNYDENASVFMKFISLDSKF